MTFDLVGTVDYAGVLTCSTQRPFDLQRRPVPELTVSGDDPDLVICEEEDLILTASYTPINGLNEEYMWEEEVDDGAGELCCSHDQCE